MRRYLGVSAVCVVLFAGAAQADMEGMKVADDPMVFKNLDADKDGLVSRNEAQSVVGLAQGFDSADSNNDGQLDPAELAVALPTPNEGE